MKGFSRRLAALVFAVTAGGVAWGLAIDYTYDVTQNNRGAAYTGGKTIQLSYTGPEPDPSHVWFHTSRVINVGGSVTVNDATGSGTIDIVVPAQGGLPSPLLIVVSPTLDPLESNELSFTYWPKPVIMDNPLLSQYQQMWANGYIEINVSGLPELENPLGGTTFKYGRTLTVEFGAGNPSTQPIFVYSGNVRVRVLVPYSVPAGQIGLISEVTLIVTVDDGDAWDEMEADENPQFWWCPEGLTLTGVSPVEGPLAGNSSAGYMTLTGTSFYPEYTYVSFDDFDGPWLPPGEIIFDSTTQIRCPLPPQPDKLEIRSAVYVKNAYEDLSARMSTIEQKGPEDFDYKDQWPTVNLPGWLIGATLGGEVLLQADAQDDRAVTRVEFRYSTAVGAPDLYDDDDLDDIPNFLDSDVYPVLGTDTTWPFEFLWQTDPGGADDGTYHLIAVAYDDHVWSELYDDGVVPAEPYPSPADCFATSPDEYTQDGKQIGESSIMTFQVNQGAADDPPQAQMVVPADGAVLSVDSGVITLSAMVADYEGLLDAAMTVEFAVVDGDGKTWSGPLPLSWLTYLYTDDTDPANPLDWYLATVNWDGMLWDAGAGAFVKAADGAHQITVEVWDTLSQSATAGVTVTVDSSAVCITSITPDGSDLLAGSDLAGADADPTSGTYHGPFTVTITGDGFVQGATAADFAGTITFAGVPATDVTRVSDTELTVVVPNLELPLSAADGTIDVSVATAAGSQTHSDMFYVEDSDPYVEFLGPQDGATVGGLVLLQADARDDSAIASVTYQYSLDDTNWFDIATVDAATDNYPFSYELDTTVAPFGSGIFYFQAIATDDGGHILTDLDVTSVVVTLDQSTYDNPPRVTINLPAHNATVSGTSVVLQATVTDLEAIEPDGLTNAFAPLPRFEIVSAGRNETLGTIILDPASVAFVTTDTWILSATWDTTEVDGSGNPVYPDGSFYVIRAAATDDADDTVAPLGEYNTGYDAVNVTVRNGVPVIPPYVGGGGGGGGCAPGQTPAPAAIFLLLGTVFLVFRRRRPAPA